MLRWQHQEYECKCRRKETPRRDLELPYPKWSEIRDVSIEHYERMTIQVKTKPRSTVKKVCQGGQRDQVCQYCCCLKEGWNWDLATANNSMGTTSYLGKSSSDIFMGADVTQEWNKRIVGTSLEEILALTTTEGSRYSRQRRKYIIHTGKHQHGLDTLPPSKKTVGESELERQTLTFTLHSHFKKRTPKNSDGLLCFQFIQQKRGELTRLGACSYPWMVYACLDKSSSYQGPARKDKGFPQLLPSTDLRLLDPQ